MLQGAIQMLAVSVPLMVWCSIFGTLWMGHSEWTEQVLAGITVLSPNLARDLSVFGEVSAPSLAAIALASSQLPNSQQRYLPIGILALGYASMLHLSWYLGQVDDQQQTYLVQLIGNMSQGSQDKLNPEVVFGFIENLRTFCLVMIGGFLGLKIASARKQDSTPSPTKP